MSLCKDCIKGVTHDGAPEGKIEIIGGVECYVGTPTADFPKDKVLLMLTDALGLPLVNNQLLVDDFAKNGFKTILPDYLHGDPIPASVMVGVSDAMVGTVFDIGKWFTTHGTADTRPLLDKVIAALKADGVTTFGAVGYCFGGRYVFDLACDGVISAAATSHPSLLQIPADLEKYVATAKAPLLINSCTVDSQFPIEAQAQADKIFASFAPGYKREYFEGCTHGFAVRGDLNDPKVKAAKEAAFAVTVEWLLKYL
ncbi:dienelactone hydrolase endo-1,3,1,4-beta-D-glucanase [Mycena belliarum]|uniref:Dienelactone hydrolase endo-1,3,1,4-beta-D-glucanase n=1 Tax=Mycena belliarum TaxID=1033014 RepID=A0AAD6TNB2_9AGAR|nr:dienelactone hydrolase endo-1,3,1,4-beta-D-glucanase [Mycena belliae]